MLTETAKKKYQHQLNELVWLLIFDEFCAQEEEFKKLLKEKELTNKKSHLLTLTLISVYIVDVRKKKSRTWRVHDSHLNIYLQKQIQETRFYNLKLLYVLEVGVIYFLLLIRVHTHTNTDEKSIKKIKICVFFSCFILKESSLTPCVCLYLQLYLCVCKVSDDYYLRKHREEAKQFTPTNF